MKVVHRRGKGQDREKGRDRVGAWVRVGAGVKHCVWWRSGRNAGARADSTLEGRAAVGKVKGQDNLEGRVKDDIEGREGRWKVSTWWMY